MHCSHLEPEQVQSREEDRALGLQDVVDVVELILRHEDVRRRAVELQPVVRPDLRERDERRAARLQAEPDRPKVVHEVVLGDVDRIRLDLVLDRHAFLLHPSRRQRPLPARLSIKRRLGQPVSSEACRVIKVLPSRGKDVPKASPRRSPRALTAAPSGSSAALAPDSCSALAISGAAAASQHAPGVAGVPDFGPNVKIFDPSMSTSEIKATVDAIAAEQVSNQFGTQRYALLFMPGTYGTADRSPQLPGRLLHRGGRPRQLAERRRRERHDRCLQPVLRARRLHRARELLALRCRT